MSAVRGCDVPEDRLYSLEHNVWLRPTEEGDIILGITAYAVSLAGTIVAYTPKRIGKTVKKDKSCATIESGHWVGPAKSPVAGTIIATNDAAAQDPALISKDPYGDGWLVKLKPEGWPAEAEHLLRGADAVVAFDNKMSEDGFEGC